MLVIDEKVFDKNMQRIREVQEYLLKEGYEYPSKSLSYVINDLNHNSIDLVQSIIKGSRLIQDEM